MATLHFAQVKIETRGDQHIFEVQVHLADIDPKAVRVELYANGINGGSPARQEMKVCSPVDRAPARLRLQWAVSAARPPADYTVRVIPHCDGVAVPLEDAHILWQR